MLDKLLKISILFDFYGALLTEKQQRCLEMHFLHDLSLSEIADQFSVSRQAIYDIIHRAEQVLTSYEEKLKLVERYQQEQHEIKAIYDVIEHLPENSSERADIKAVLIKLSKLIGKIEEV
ncbi:YlxM family DNA-binding protein [Anaerosinus massiliensis]|uniref:YlxM family DNA-binding protein n=1 Tax=Massilibacillus massiliensis TaxID=1806837 RepID=UPI000AB8E5DC|nr:putative DNA-binding protein [Massilibacillus massiliensis]